MTQAKIVPIRRDSEYPERPKGAYHKDGYVYIVEFSNGTVKVGKARSLRHRLAVHRRDAEKFNMAISRWWGSPLHRNYEDSEEALIDFAVGEGERSGGREYFTGVSFSAIRSFASSLPMSPTSPGLAAAEIKSDEERDKAFIAHLFSSHEHPAIKVDSKLNAYVLWWFFDPTMEIPKVSYEMTNGWEEEFSDIADTLVTEFGYSLDDLKEWGVYDWMCEMLEVVTSTAKLRLLRKIREQGRYDLLESLFYISTEQDEA